MDTADGESAKAPTPDRSKRIYVLWGVGFAFLAALGFFCWFVARPILQVRAAAEELSGLGVPRMWAWPAEFSAPLVVRLGGSREAAGKLGLFLRAPKWACGRPENRAWAVTLLANCGKPALSEPSSLMDSRDKETRLLAMDGMLTYSLNHHLTYFPGPSLLPIPWLDTDVKSGDAGGDAEGSRDIDQGGSLKAATKDEDPQVREAATKALKIWEAELSTMAPKPY